ncbi:MAG: hypothetical protein H6828_05255 [Planctomycetes bacterium]|nr:hypothetical protein [Planctomycetota bacterium]
MKLARSLAILVLAGLACAAPQRDTTADEAWSARLQEVVAQLPAYEGKHRYALDAPTRAAVLNAQLDFEALLRGAPEGHPSLAYAWGMRAEAWTLLAEDHRSRGREDDARRAYEDALACCTAGGALAPADAWYPYGRGMARYALGRYAEAVEDFAAAMQLAGAGADLHYRAGYRRGTALGRLGELDAAEAAFRAHVELYGKEEWRDWDVGMARVDVLLWRGDFAAAAARLQALLEVEAYAAYPDAWEQLGYVQALLDRPDASVRSLDEALLRSQDVGQQLYLLLYRWIVQPSAEHAGELEELLLGADFEAWDRLVATWALVATLPEGRAEALRALCPDLAEPEISTTQTLLERAAAREFERRAAAGEPCAGTWCERDYFEGLHYALGRQVIVSEEGPPLPPGQRRPSPLALLRRAAGAPLADFVWEQAFARLLLARYEPAALDD